MELKAYIPLLGFYLPLYDSIIRHFNYQYQFFLISLPYKKDQKILFTYMYVSIVLDMNIRYSHSQYLSYFICMGNQRVHATYNLAMYHHCKRPEDIFMIFSVILSSFSSNIFPNLTAMPGCRQLVDPRMYILASIMYVPGTKPPMLLSEIFSMEFHIQKVALVFINCFFHD